MTAMNKCLLYAFLCLAIFCEIDSKDQIPNDGTINIDDTLKGEVIEGSGRGGQEDDVDQEESSGGLEDDEDTPLLSSMTPSVPGQRGRSSGGETDSTSFEFGSGDGRQGNDGREDAATTTTTAGPSLFSSSSSVPSVLVDEDDLEWNKPRVFATSAPPPPPPTLLPASPSSTLAPTTRPATTTTAPTTTSTTTTTTTNAARPSYGGENDDEDVSVSEGSGFYGSNDNKDTIPPSAPTTTTTTTTRPTTTTTTTRTRSTTTSDYRFVGSNEFDRGEEEVERSEEVEVKKETSLFGGPPPSRVDNDDEDEFDVVGRGSGHSPTFEKAEGGGPEGDECRDRDERCSRYERENRCHDWVPWMKTYCPRICGFCSPGEDGSADVTFTTSRGGKKKNRNKAKNKMDEVSKPPTTNYKPRKPDPTKFVTHYNPNKEDGKGKSTYSVDLKSTKIPNTVVVGGGKGGGGGGGGLSKEIDFSLEKEYIPGLDKEKCKNKKCQKQNKGLKKPQVSEPEPDFEEEKNKIHHDGGTGYDEKNPDDDDMGNDIPSIGKAVMGPKQRKNDSSLWKQPGILAVWEGQLSPFLILYLGIIGAAVVGLLCAVLLVMFIVYRMRKKDEGSYDLDETTKRSPRINGYQRTNQNEFYA